MTPATSQNSIGHFPCYYHLELVVVLRERGRQGWTIAGLLFETCRHKEATKSYVLLLTKSGKPLGGSYTCMRAFYAVKHCSMVPLVLLVAVSLPDIEYKAFLPKGTSFALNLFHHILDTNWHDTCVHTCVHLQTHLSQE